MKKHTITLITSAALLFVIAGCKKDKKEDTPQKSKTELLTQTTWKFDKATSNGTDVTGFINDCWKDNTADFDAASNTEITGTGSISEGANVCASSAAGPFTWNFQSSETVLFMSTPVIPTGSGTFNIVTLNETNMVLSQDVNLGPPLGMQNVVFTFKH
jgi:hypothetical protein